jgi:DNA repair photolyase
VYPPDVPRKGRGAVSNPPSRFDATRSERIEEDGAWDDELPPLPTTVSEEPARSIISRNDSPDIPFDVSLNPYRGCEHGCIYCYARPTHAYLGLSPGLDFETRLFVKRDAAALLRKELSQKSYRCSPFALGAVTDPYQPIERRYRSTRGLLEVLDACSHPLTITTKSSLIERDLELLSGMAARRLLEVQISLTTLDRQLARVLEPRATAPARRVQTIARLAEAGVPTRVMVAPVIPFINDAEIESILAAASDAGATEAGYIVLRMPLEVADLFEEWLNAHFPLKARRVLHCLEQLHGGRRYDSRFGTRQSGSGIFADLLARRFDIVAKRHGLNRQPIALDTTQFVPPRRDDRQMELF